jgi:hypothetical protein
LERDVHAAAEIRRQDLDLDLGIELAGLLYAFDKMRGTAIRRDPPK